jgi:DNA-binding YbaB/EbfC family protein
MMKNIGQIMKQAQQMQTKMAELQAQLAELEVLGLAGGGMVQVTMNGKGELRGVKIDPSLADPDDIEVLEDLIMAAANDAKAKVEARVQEEMQKLTGGLQLPPGMQLPF